ncbi:Fc.00g112860.m01.CDS01 [Cosmosporella sp. VM-42]
MAENTTEPATSTRQSSGGGGAITKSSSNVSFDLQRKKSHSERINEILENAQKRAETMGTISPRTPGSPAHPQPATAQPIPEDSSADEMTGIMSRGSEHNYHSVQTTQNNEARSRKSTVRSRRPQPGSVHSDAVQPPPEREMEYTGPREEERVKTPWWKGVLKRFQSIELENKGSVARDHLAIERTFLAWLRTSLAFASIGIAVTQLFRLNTSLIKDGQGGSNGETLRQMGKPLGATFLGISILILFLGYKRYFMSQEWVMRGKFPASRGTVTIVAFVAFAIMVASLVVVIAIHPSDREV